MTKNLSIGIRLLTIGSLDLTRPGNVQGDEQVARAWAKYLLRRDEVKNVTLMGSGDGFASDIDCVINFSPFLEPTAGCLNLLYLQNAFPRDKWAGGTVGVFESIKHKFDGFIFTSQRLMHACCDGPVIPFATDPEIFSPQICDSFKHSVCFVGNDIRGPLTNHRFMVPTIPFGLVIYGNNTWAPPLAGQCRGRLPVTDLPKVYSSAEVNLNAHIPEHILFDTVNLRLFDILACGGFAISDELVSIADFFENSVICTSGYEDLWAKLVHYLNDGAERKRRSLLGRRIVLEKHTYAQRIEILVGNLVADF